MSFSKELMFEFWKKMYDGTDIPTLKEGYHRYCLAYSDKYGEFDADSKSVREVCIGEILYNKNPMRKLPPAPKGCINYVDFMEAPKKHSPITRHFEQWNDSKKCFDGWIIWNQALLETYDI